MIHVPMTPGRIPGSHHGGGTAWMIWALALVPTGSAVALTLAVVIRPPAVDRYARSAKKRHHRTEALIMTAGLAAMALPMR